MKKIVKKSIRWVIIFICLVIFFGILENVYQNEIHNFDKTIYKAVAALISKPVTFIMKVITNISSAPVIIIITLLIIAAIKNKKMSLCIISNLIIITTLNQTLKRIIARPRPTEFRIIDQSGYSFPSGHSMVSMAFFGLLIYIAYNNIENKTLRSFVCISLSILILLIGISRIYLGVHYPSDVIAGFVLSIAYLALFTNITNKHIVITEKNK